MKRDPIYLEKSKFDGKYYLKMYLYWRYDKKPTVEKALKDVIKYFKKTKFKIQKEPGPMSYNKRDI